MKTLAMLTALVLLGSLGIAAVQAQVDRGPITTFEAQASGGHEVVVPSVDLPEGGFVAIHDATLLEGAVFTSVIGISEALPAGASEQVRVQLTRALVGDNETLVAMPHKDSNANGIYDFVSSAGAEDGPFVGGQDAIDESALPAALQGLDLGGISAVVAQVNVTASIQARDQVGSGRSILIDSVDLSAPGYVAVHDATLVAAADESGIDPASVLTSVVGVSDLLPAGRYTDLLVAVGNNCEGCKAGGSMNGTLVPMAHRETNGNEAYDFVSSEGAADGPFVGQPGTPLTAVIAVLDTDSSDVATETFSAQASGGRSVLFAEVFVPQGGYAAVHDATLLEGNVLGSVLGVSTFLDPGLHRNVTVELAFNGSRGLNESATVIGMLHRETNGNEAYDFVASQGADDGPYVGGPNGLAEADLPEALQGLGIGGVNAVSAMISVAASARIAAHQTSEDGASVTLESVDLSEAGFVALHDTSLLGDATANVLASVVGVSAPLEAGFQENVTIRLPGDNCAGCVKGALNTSQTLIAMPHKDSNANGVYDFITSAGAEDGPFVTTGAVGNTASALDLNIVVAIGRVTAPIVANATSEPATPTPATPANGTTPATPNGTTPATPNGTTPATPNGTTPATPNGTMPATPNGTMPATPAGPPRDATPDESTNETPGLGLLALLAAVGLVVLVLRRRRS